MHGAVSICNSAVAADRMDRARRAPLEKRRRYNRLYMRAWRTHPANITAERQNRARWHYQRKLREALQRTEDSDKKVNPVCGFCRKQQPVTKVWRLEIRDLAPRGYVEVRVPYCGEC